MQFDFTSDIVLSQIDAVGTAFNTRFPKGTSHLFIYLYLLIYFGQLSSTVATHQQTHH